jgi:hypothetical protein
MIVNPIYTICVGSYSALCNYYNTRKRDYYICISHVVYIYYLGFSAYTPYTHTQMELYLYPFFPGKWLEPGEVNWNKTGIKPLYNWHNSHSTFKVCSMYVQCTSKYRLWRYYEYSSMVTLTFIESDTGCRPVKPRLSLPIQTLSAVLKWCWLKKSFCWN